MTLPAILSEGRKFGLRAVVAHQYMKQLGGPLAEAITGSVASRIVFRVGTEDAAALAPSFLPEFIALDHSSMPQFTAAARVADSGHPTRPFTLVVDHTERVQQLEDAYVLREIERRSRVELVDPYRHARPLSLRDLQAPPLPGPSFIDSWINARK